MTKNTSSIAIFTIASLVSLTTSGDLCAENLPEKAEKLKRLVATLEVSRGTQVVKFENDLPQLLSLAEGITPEQAQQMSQGVGVSVNGFQIPPCEERKIPVRSGKYTMSIHNQPKFGSTLASLMTQSSNYVKAAVFTMASKVIDLYKVAVHYECEHDGAEEQCVTNIIISHPELRNLIDQPKGLYQTIRELVSKAQISLPEWFHLSFQLPGVSRGEETQEI